MSKELYNQFKGAENKLESLKVKTQDELKGLALYIYQNSHSVRDDVKTDMDLYGEVAKAMIYKSLDGLDENATQEEIKEKIKEVMLLEGLVAKKDKHLKDFKDKYQEGIDRAADKLAQKIKARGGTPQSDFDEMALDNPGWFRQIIEFFARCLSISTEYNSMRSVKNQSQEMNEEVKKAEMRRHLVKDRVFETIAEPQQINGSVHQVGKVKKVKVDGQEEANKHKQEWFKKKAGWGLVDIIYWFGSIIGDHNKAEVIGAELLRTLMGNYNVPKYRLTEDGSVISQRVGFDDESGNYNHSDILTNRIYGINAKTQNELKSFAKEFVKLHGYNLIIGNPDLHNNNILVVDNELIPIDFGYSSRELKDDNLVNYKFNVNPDTLEPNQRNMLQMYGLRDMPQNIKNAINQCRKEALKEVAQEVEGKKEELYKKIEDTCYALGIGERQARLVMEAIDKNIELVRREAGMGIGRQV